MLTANLCDSDGRPRHSLGRGWVEAEPAVGGEGRARQMRFLRRPSVGLVTEHADAAGVRKLNRVARHRWGPRVLASCAGLTDADPCGGLFRTRKHRTLPERLNSVQDTEEGRRVDPTI